MQATLLTLAIAAILALLAALVGPHFIDWNAHRATFEKQASQAIGLPVRVTGPMDVRLLPAPTLVLTGVEIGEPGDAQALRAKALGIEFALPPLLSGQLRAIELRLIAPEMRVSLTRDGEIVMPNALAGIDTHAMSIDKLVVEDASLRLADAASGTSAALTRLWFTGEVRALPGPIRGEGAFVMDGALYGYRIATARPEANGSRIKFAIEPANRPVVAEAEGLLMAGDGAPRFEGTATIGRRPQVKGDRGDTAEPWRITARVKANAASALFEQVEYQFGPDERALKLQGTAEAKFGARPRLDAVLTARTLDADKLLGGSGGGDQSPRAALTGLIAAAERIVGPPMPTQVGFGIEQITLGGASLQNIRGDIEFDRGHMALTGFEVRAPGFTQLQASGRIEKAGDRLSFAGPVAVSSTDPRAFAEWIDGQSGASALPARPLRFRGEVTLGADKVAVERMHAEFDRKTFEGDFSYAFASGAQAARLVANLRADDLDLDALLETAGALKLPDIKRPDDVSLALALKRLRFGGFDADGANVRLALKAGNLAIERLAVDNVAGLSLDGKGSVDVEARRGSVSFDVAVRNEQDLAALAKRAPERLAEPLQRAAQAAVPGKLAGTVTVEPAGGAGDSRATISLSGRLGAVDLSLKTGLRGRWDALRQADVALEGSLDSGDVNALLKLAAAERLVAAPRQPGTYTLSLNGGLSSDLKVDSRIVSGNLDMRAHGTVRALGDDAGHSALDIAIGRADVVLPGAAVRTVPVALKTRVLRDGSGLRLDDLSGTIAGSAVRGWLALVFGEPLAIDGELRTDRLDVAAVVATAIGIPRAARGETAWSETPFALPALPKLSGRMQVSAAQAALTPALPLTKYRSVLRFAENEVNVEDLAGEVLGGRLTGGLTIRRAPDAVGLQGSIAVAGADATQLLFGDGAAPLTGQAALTLELEGMGRSPRALVGSLSGTGTLTLDHARIAALDPAVFVTAMSKADQGLPIDAPRVRDVAKSGLDAGPLVVPHAEATLNIGAGVARIDMFKARAEAADLAVTGSYNFSDARIDLRLAMSGPAAGASLQPEITVYLRGPSAAPERVLDVSSLTGWLALRAVDRHTRKIEAMEQGRAAEEAPAQPEKPAQDAEPATSVRRKPQAAVQPPQAVEPLPPPVEIMPVPGERRRPVAQPREPRAEPQRSEPQRSEPQRSGGANPFPTPIGSPPPPPPVARPFPPQTVRPVF